MKIDVKQGIIHINSVSVMQCSETAVLLYADTRQKYPELWGIGGNSEGAHEVNIGVGDRTLFVEENKNDLPSTIKITGFEGRWRVVAEAGRYDVMIALVKEAEIDTFREMDWYDGKES